MGGLDYNLIWNRFLDKMRNELEPINFETWFEDTKLIDIKDGIAKIQVTIPIAKKHIKDIYNDLATHIFNEVTESNFKLDYLTEDEIETNIVIGIDKIGMPKPVQYETNLDPNYTFETFLSGKSNTFAKKNAFAIAERPGMLYNPFFIYGPSGVGKTHLMHAIGNYITNTTNKRVLYVTSEKFVNDFIRLFADKDTRNFKTTDEFKSKYRDVDVLIIDDIQYLQEATKTQQEFFNTFNELHSSGKQIILSSDRSPHDLKKLEERLRTRFNWGLTVDIMPPDFDLRINIINNLLEREQPGVYFPNDVIELIAGICTTDVRNLQGCIRRITVYAVTMNGADITYELAHEALKGYMMKNTISKNKIDQVQQYISQNFNVSVEDLKSKKRNAKITYPRQIAMYICRQYLEESLVRIGNEFGGRDHTTVKHSVEKIEKEIKVNKNLNDIVQKIINQIR